MFYLLIVIIICIIYASIFRLFLPIENISICTLQNLVTFFSAIDLFQVLFHNQYKKDGDTHTGTCPIIIYFTLNLYKTNIYTLALEESFLTIPTLLIVVIIVNKVRSHTTHLKGTNDTHHLEIPGNIEILFFIYLEKLFTREQGRHYLLRSRRYIMYFLLVLVVVTQMYL